MKCKQIPLTRGMHALVDAEDFDKVNQFEWFASPNGRTFYAMRHPYDSKTGKQSTEIMHRLILGARPGQAIDHLDGDGLNNQKKNLRFASPGQNGANRKKNSGHTYSTFKGVTWHKRKKKWMASLKVAGKSLFLGYWEVPEDAARAYDIAAKQHFSDYARTNF